MDSSFVLERQQVDQYKGFQVSVNDYRNIYTGKTIVREVVVIPIQVPDVVALVFKRRVYSRSRFNKFRTINEAKSVINGCYRAFETKRN